MVVAEPIEDVARALAAAHATDSHDDLKVYWQRADGDCIRLIEVSAHFSPSPETDWVRALWFAPDRLRGVPSRVEAALATADEWARLGRRELTIGHGWRSADLAPIWPA